MESYLKSLRVTVLTNATIESEMFEIHFPLLYYCLLMSMLQLLLLWMRDFRSVFAVDVLLRVIQIDHVKGFKHAIRFSRLFVLVADDLDNLIGS